MKDAFGVLGMAVAAMLLLYASVGYRAAYQISFGAFTLMAAMVSLTYLWLWFQRSTSLAVGMAFGWAGAASVMGWWWVFNLLDGPEQMIENAMLFVCLSVYFVGAVMHFAVIGRSLGLGGSAWMAPVAVAVTMSAMLYITRL